MDVVVVGLGRGFHSLKDIILKHYNVICVSDSFYANEDTEYMGLKYVPINSIGSIECDLILICFIDYATYWEIKNILLNNAKVDKNKISDIYAMQELQILKQREIYPYKLDKFETDLKKYRSLNKNSDKFHANEENLSLFVDEYDYEASGISIFYMLFEHWCAKHIYRERPSMHFDIGGRFEGFINRLLTFEQQVTMIDIRPFNYKIEGLTFIQADAVELKGIKDESVESLSCMGVLQTIGTGRYGDPVNPDAWIACLKSIQRVVKKGGIVYIADSIGKEHMRFNLGRVFYASTIVNAMDEMELEEFVVTDSAKDGDHYYDFNCGLHDYDNSMNHRIFGCFKFRKK